MLTSITTSQFTERLIYLMLVDGHYRKYLSRLHERLGEARLNVVRAFERIGLEIFVEPADGMFIWARFPHINELAAAGGDIAAAGHYDSTRSGFPSASRAFSVDAIWRRRVRREARTGSAGATGSKCGSFVVPVTLRPYLPGNPKVLAYEAPWSLGDGDAETS